MYYTLEPTTAPSSTPHLQSSIGGEQQEKRDGGSVKSVEGSTLTCFNTCWVRVVNSCWLEGLPVPPNSTSSVSYPLSDLFLEDPGLLLIRSVYSSLHADFGQVLKSRSYAGIDWHRKRLILQQVC